MNQEEFEIELKRFFTDGNSIGLSLLKDQLSHSIVESREMTGVGLYININVDQTLVKPFVKDCTFGDVYIQADGLDEGAGAVVYIKSGYVTTFECFSYGDGWPSDYKNVLFKYTSEPRDLTDLDNSVA